MASLKSIPVSEFKKVADVEIVNIVKSPLTSKLFAAASNGQNYKVEAAIDLEKPVSFLWDEEGSMDDGCFVNTRDNNVVASL